MLIIFFVVLQLVVTSFLTGLIWFVQLVHYPLFRKIPPDSFVGYHHLHMRNTTFLVVPVMIIEALIVSFLVFLFQRGTEQYFITLAGLIVLALIWLSTFALQVPRHLRLRLGHQVESIDILIKTNWIRTVLWSLRLIISIFTLKTFF